MSVGVVKWAHVNVCGLADKSIGRVKFCKQLQTVSFLLSSPFLASADDPREGTDMRGRGTQEEEQRKRNRAC